MNNKTNITATSLKLFLEFAEDANNWGSQVPCGERVANVKVTKETRGNLTQLKKAGLITVTMEESGTHPGTFDPWLTFTPAGIALAKNHGFTVQG